ncbi:MAG: phosphatidylglycerophosphatase A [Deltaproteobacteria bacterium]|nr:phosphatidylglycerophosphatase A [Deltaproteobacteria bacterium]
MRLAGVTSFAAQAVATAGGVGYSPVAPGTCGTLVAIPLAWACRDLELYLYLGIVVLVTLGGIAAAARADVVWGTHDSGRIVIDEVAGYLVTMTLVDRSAFWPLAIGFVVFRALDIIKPPPVRWFDEKMPGGAGVVLDDVVAGVMGAAVMVGLDAAGAFTALAQR